MSESKAISINQSKGNINDYIIKDKDNILIGRFTITELDKESKRCNIRLKFFKNDKHNLLRESVISIVRAIFKDNNTYKVNILVDENTNYKVFLDLGFTLEGIFSENLFSNGIFLDELSFGVNRNDFNNIQRNYIVKLKGKNILLRNLNPEDSEDLLQYYIRNEDHLRNYEPSRDKSFYTIEAQKDILLESYKGLMNGKCVDLGIYKDDNLIGKIKISNIVYGVFKSGIIGYSMDKDYQGRGYMKEALSMALRYARDELELHRLEASVLVDNQRSKNVLTSCGFKEVGLNEKYLFINGGWKDHLTFYRVLEDF